MGIRMTGIDYNTADIDTRSIFSFTRTRAAEAMKKIRAQAGIEGCVLLSTCNRTELWVSVKDGFQTDLAGLLCGQKGVSADSCKTAFHAREGRDAAIHLFRLCAGLESQILGEDQIITQVNEALQHSREQETADHVLETLFRQAVTAGKKIKTKFAFSPAGQSAVCRAVEVVKQNGFDFRGKTCMVIGNGAMGRLAAARLKDEGACVTVTVRQYHRGMVDIPRDCSRIDYGRRMELFGDCDCVISATVSPNYTLTRSLVAEHLKKPVILIDLAVPRDMEASIRELDAVTLYDIDDFRKDAENEEQKTLLQQAQMCLTQDVDAFFRWYEYVDVIPKLQILKERIADDLLARLTREFRKLPLDGDGQKKLEMEVRAAAVRTANKLLFGLKDGIGREAFGETVNCLEDIYGG